MVENPKSLKMLRIINFIVLSLGIAFHTYAQNTLLKDNKIIIGCNTSLVEARANINWRYKSDLIDFSRRQKNTFESRGVGIHVLCTFDSVQSVGARISWHRFQWFGHNLLFTDRSNGFQFDLIYKANIHLFGKALTSEYNLGYLHSQTQRINLFFTGYSSIYPLNGRLTGTNFDSKLGYPIRVGNWTTLTLGAHMGYISLNIKELGKGVLDHQEISYDLGYFSYQIGLFTQIDFGRSNCKLTNPLCN